MKSQLLLLFVLISSGVNLFARPSVGLKVKNSSFAEKGISSGGGLDTQYMIHRSVWFVGKGKTIRYCVERSNEMPFSEDEYAHFIEGAFTQWFSYLNNRLDWINNSDANFPYFSTKFERVTSCAEDNDLSFYFGVQNETIEKIKRKYLDPISFAEQTHRDNNTGWSKGILWFSPKFFQPAKKEVTQTAILHELGHTFNFENTPHTIMDESLYTQLNDSKIYNKIDHRFELVPGNSFSPRGNYRQRGVINIDRDKAKATFFKLTQKTPKGEVQAEIRRIENDNNKFEVIFNDEESSFKKILSVNVGGELSSNWSHVIFIAANENDNIAFYHAPYSLDAQLKDETGTLSSFCRWNQGLYKENDVYKIPQERIDSREEFGTLSSSLQCIIGNEELELMGPSAYYNGPWTSTPDSGNN